MSTTKTAKTGTKTRPVRRCLECGGTMRRGSREDRVEYKGRSRTFRATAWWCEACGESVQEGAALKKAERMFVELRAEVDEILLPEDVAAVRARLHMSQREAGRVLGGGPRAFQKYESGQVPVSAPMHHLLVLLKNDPGRLAELRAEAAKRTGRRGGTATALAGGAQVGKRDVRPARSGRHEEVRVAASRLRRRPPAARGAAGRVRP